MRGSNWVSKIIVEQHRTLKYTFLKFPSKGQVFREVRDSITVETRLEVLETQFEPLKKIKI